MHRIVAATTLWVLTTVAFLLLVQSALSSRWDNVRTWPPREIWEAPLVETGTAATFFVGVIGLLVVRQQFQVGLRPLIGYGRYRGREVAHLPLDPMDDDGIAVKLENNGLGPAIVRRVMYEVVLGGDDGRALKGDRWTVVAALSEAGLEEGKDYMLVGFSENATIRKDGSEWFGMFGKRFCEEVQLLNATFEFEAVLGERFSKHLECLRDAP